MIFAARIAKQSLGYFYQYGNVNYPILPRLNLKTPKKLTHR
jgi:hypothetical protein